MNLVILTKNERCINSGKGSSSAENSRVVNFQKATVNKPYAALIC